MREQMSVLLLLFVAGVTVVGCSGGGGAGSASGLPKPGGSVSPPTAVPAINKQGVAVHILIPLASRASLQRRPQYVSASTLSASVEVNGSPPPEVTDLSPTSASCTASPGGGRDCTVAITAPDGNDTFDVRLFDAANAAGSVLSRVTSSQTITDQTTTVDFTLNGVVKSVVLSPSAITLPAGTATAAPVLINAKDADGNTIIAPGGYVDTGGNPISIKLNYTDSMAMSAATITGSAATGPGGTQAFAYNGSPSLGGTVGATVSGTSQTISSNAVGVTITPTVVASATLPPNVTPSCIVVGSDRSLVFAGRYFSPTTGVNEPVFGKLTSSSTVATYPMPIPSGMYATVQCAVLGPDSRVWTSLNAAGFAALSTSGAVSVYPNPTADPSAPASPTPTPIPYQAGNGQLVESSTGLVGLTYFSPYGYYPILTNGTVSSPMVTIDATAVGGSPQMGHGGVFDSNGRFYTIDTSTTTGAPQLQVLASGQTTTFSIAYTASDLARGANGSAYLADGASVYKLSPSGVVPVSMTTTAPNTNVLSLAAGVRQDLWAGGTAASLDSLTHVSSAGTGTPYKLPFQCALYELAGDPVSGKLYAYDGAASGNGCGKIVTIIY